ncbi:cupin domain-containing protein [Ramlibacter sp.]|uniref:cupin domain-containing protein n=1 Tax=Ramlibacter sp. TaxID=1917967 RepID=UPI002D8040E6|nr:cupin domain-containing protein [Ramlibacter sp.]
MSATGTERQSANFAVSSRKIVAEGTDVQVKEFVLQPGESVPWHHHTAVFDVFYCLEGRLTVERTDVKSGAHQPDLVLAVGDSAKVEPGTAHHPVNQQQERCRFLLVQGIGRYDFLRFAPTTR